MALVRSQKVTETVDAKSAIFYDTTTLQDYIDNGIDIDTDIVSVTLKLVDDITSTEYTYDATSSFSSMRDAGGLTVSALDFSYPSEKFTDDLYNIKIDLVENSTGGSITYTSETNQFFYAQVKNGVVETVVKSDWRTVFDMNSRSSRSKTWLKLKSWLDSLIIADEQGFLTEGKKILNALKIIVL
jgi:hypothetical protein